MEDFLHTIANNVQRGNHQGGGNGVNQYSNFKDFMDTRLTEVVKTEYATHQLQEPAGMWWKHHHTTFL
jgi:hypothetical protein